MARKPSKNLTERELEIMQVVLHLGEARLGDVQEALNRSGDPVAPSTVATQLNILVNKGYLTQSGRHGRYIYLATCSKEEATKSLLDDFVQRVGLGQTASFLIGLLKQEKLSARDRAALQDMLSQESTEKSRRSRGADGRPAEEQAP